MQTEVPDAILKLWPAERWSGTTGVLAISGGADSVAMLRAFCELREKGSVAADTRFAIAHFNHQLRGEESDQDEAFVKSLADQWNLPVYIGYSPVPPELDSSMLDIPRGNEAQWRRDRNKFFREVAQRSDANWIATGATADDQIETALHHLLRGSGPAGIAGVRSTRTIAPELSLVHPLVETWKPQIVEYLKSLGQEYRSDSSNATLHFTRNRIRLELIPLLESFAGNPHLKQRLLVATQLIRDEHTLIEQMAHEWLEKAPIEISASGFQCPLSAVETTPWPILQAAFVELWHRLEWPLQDCTFRHWQRANDLLKQAALSTHPKRLQFPSGIHWQCARKILRVTRQA